MNFKQNKHAWPFDQAKECIKLYTKDSLSLEKLALHFNCSRGRIEHLLKSRGYSIAERSV